MIPTANAYIGVSSAYQAGTTVFDFSHVKAFPPIFTVDPAVVPPTVATEIAYFDAKNDPRGRSASTTRGRRTGTTTTSTRRAASRARLGPGTAGSTSTCSRRGGHQFNALDLLYENPQTQRGCC